MYTLKNPSFYETKIETWSGCMCLHFHPEFPYMLAAGFYDGSVCAYDLRNKNRKNATFCIKSENAKHCDAVWQVSFGKNVIFCKLKL